MSSGVGLQQTMEHMLSFNIFRVDDLRAVPKSHHNCVICHKSYRTSIEIFVHLLALVSDALFRIGSKSTILSRHQCAAWIFKFIHYVFIRSCLQIRAPMSISGAHCYLKLHTVVLHKIMKKKTKLNLTTKFFFDDAMAFCSNHQSFNCIREQRRTQTCIFDLSSIYVLWMVKSFSFVARETCSIHRVMFRMPTLPTETLYITEFSCALNPFRRDHAEFLLSYLVRLRIIHVHVKIEDGKWIHSPHMCLISSYNMICRDCPYDTPVYMQMKMKMKCATDTTMGSIILHRMTSKRRGHSCCFQFSIFISFLFLSFSVRIRYSVQKKTTSS